MEKINVNILQLCGTNYEVGYYLGTLAKNNKDFMRLQKSYSNTFTKKEADEMLMLFDKYCKGLNDELKGFANAIGVKFLDMVYYSMTYLTPGCSLIALLPTLTENNHVMVARNYEFSHKMEDFSFCKTKIKGKYAHMGGTIMQFGRSEGINECGLMVGQSSCGMPVGNMKNMRKPAIKGLQFFAVIRSLLENCKNVKEALILLKDMPIAYNINLILADKSGQIALFETLDGIKAVKIIDSTTKDQYLHSTNHAHLKEIKKIEPLAMEHSVKRYEYIKEYVDNIKNLTADDLKELLLLKYPSGLCCHFYEQFFGTIKSMVFDVNLGTVDICWGGNEKNGWKKYSFDEKMEEEDFLVDIKIEQPDFDFCRLI